MKIPVNSEPLFELVAVDLWRVEAPTQNIASTPSNRVQQALKRGDNTWVCVIQIMVPGPPHFAFVAYFVPRQSKGGTAMLHDQSTPFGRLARPFFFGDDDDFRDDHFKLIPRVVEGNFIVRNAVGTKPTILGRKLKQHYFRGREFCPLRRIFGSGSLLTGIFFLRLPFQRTTSSWTSILLPQQSRRRWWVWLMDTRSS